MRKFKVILQSDSGEFNIIVIARNSDIAIDMVCKSEGCPVWAVLRVKLIERLKTNI